jgi:hypothetical protein
MRCMPFRIRTPAPTNTLLTTVARIFTCLASTTGRDGLTSIAIFGTMMRRRQRRKPFSELPSHLTPVPCCRRQRLLAHEELGRRPIRNTALVQGYRPAMDTDQRGLLVRLLVVTGILISSLFSLVAVLSHAHSFILLRSIVFVASPVIFVLSLVLLVATVWRGVSIHGMPRMEAWWWLSAPYSTALPLSVRLFHAGDLGDILTLLVFLALITAVSSGAWMLVTIYHLTVSKRTTVNSKSVAMIAVVVLAGILWATTR